MLHANKNSMIDVEMTLTGTKNNIKINVKIQNGMHTMTAPIKGPIPTIESPHPQCLPKYEYINETDVITSNDQKIKCNTIFMF